MAVFQEQEYVRLCDELSPVVNQKLDTINPILNITQAKLVLLAALFRQTVTVANMLGMTKEQFVDRARWVADTSFNRSPPRTLLHPTD